MTPELSYIHSELDTDASGIASSSSSSAASSPRSSESPRKRACTACHIRKKRCDAGLPVCLQCVRFGTTCCYVPSTTSIDKQERQMQKRARKAHVASELARKRRSLADGTKSKLSTSPQKQQQQHTKRNAIKAELERILENASLPSVLQPSPPRSDSMSSGASTPALSPNESWHSFSFDSELSSSWSRHERRPAMNVHVTDMADQACDLTMSPVQCAAFEPISLPPPTHSVPVGLNLHLNMDYNSTALAFAEEELTIPETVWHELGVSHVNKTLTVDEMLSATFDINSDLLQSIFSPYESVSVPSFTVDNQMLF